MRSFLSISLSTLLATGLAINPTMVQAQSSLGSPITPIQHLVVIFPENESYDHYFGTYPNAVNPPGEPAFHALSGTPSSNNYTANPALISNNPNATNTANGTSASGPFRLDRSQAYTADMNHGYTAEESASDNGKMDLFPLDTGSAGTSNNPPVGYPPVVRTKGLVMGYYDGNTATAFWNYAQHFAMDDNAWTTTFGPSTPGAIEVISGQNNGATSTGTSSALVSDGNGGFSDISDADPTGDICSSGTTIQMTGKNIGDLLNTAGISWGGFMGGFNLNTVNANGTTGCHRSTVSPITGNAVADYVQHHAWFQYYVSTENPNHVAPASPLVVGQPSDTATHHMYDINDFYAAVQAGNFPAVSYLKAPSYQDGHPGNSNPLDEQAFMVHVVNFLQQQGVWANTAVVVTYDDSDGWYDHAPPPIINGSSTSADTLNGAGVCQGTGYPNSTPATALPGNNPATLHAQGRCGLGTRIPFVVISPWAKTNYISHVMLDQSSVVKFIEDNWLNSERIQGSFDSIAGDMRDLFDFTKTTPNPGLLLNETTGEPQ